jgi:spore germination protein
MRRWIVGAVESGLGPRRGCILIAGISIASLLALVSEPATGIGNFTWVRRAGEPTETGYGSSLRGAGQRPPVQVFGYVPENDGQPAWTSAEMHREVLSGVSVVQYYLDGDGNLGTLPGGGAVPGWAVTSGLRVVPLIQNNDGDWNRPVVARVLNDPRRRQHHIDRIVTLVVSGGYPGVELDYENLLAVDREPFSTFIEELARALHDRQKQLLVAVHAKLSEPGEWDGARAQDWSRIGAAADWVIVMSYDADPSRPGPIAPLGWTRAVLQFAVARVPPGKVIQGIPFYGHDWSSSGVVERTYRQIQQIAHNNGTQPRRDMTDRHLVLEYTQGNTRHEVWFTDGETVAALTAIGREVGVAGYALWRLGGEDPTVWDVLAGVPLRSERGR